MSVLSSLYLFFPSIQVFQHLPQTMVSFTKSLFSIGVIYSVVNLYRLVRFIHVYTRTSSLPRYLHASSSGNKAWALVTGASDGIGLQLVRELASRGFNVVLHGRNKVKLDKIIIGLSQDFSSTEFKAVVLDASLSGDALIQGLVKVVSEIKHLNLTVLVNNVGGPPAVAIPAFVTFDKSTTEINNAWIDMNARFPVQLTHLLLPTLLAHQPALIVTLSSMADEGNPWLTMYSGSKAFIMSWCKGLAREMKAEGRDVEVLGIRTAQVTGASQNTKKPTLVMPDAKVYAKAVLDKVGCGMILVNG